MEGTYAALEETKGNELYPGMQAAFLEVSHHVDRGRLLDGGWATLLVDVGKNLAFFLEIHLYEVQETFAVVGKELSDEEESLLAVYIHLFLHQHQHYQISKHLSSKLLEQILVVAKPSV